MYILLVLIINARGTAITSAEFSSKITCDAAAKSTASSLANPGYGDYYVKTTCVQK